MGGGAHQELEAVGHKAVALLEKSRARGCPRHTRRRVIGRRTSSSSGRRVCPCNDGVEEDMT